MIIAKFAGAALAVSAAVVPGGDPNGSPVNLTVQQKNAAVQPLMRSLRSFQHFLTMLHARSAAGAPVKNA